jgi:hypothetical protein
MPTKVYAIVFGLFVVITGCKSGDSPAPSQRGDPGSATPANAANPAAPASVTPSAPAVKAKIDVCQLLTTNDLKAVQGEPFKEAQRSDRQEGGFIVAQCYYALPTSANSVVLNVTTAGESGGAASPRKFWEDTFGKEEREARNKSTREKRAEKQKKPEGGEEEEESAPPAKVNGVGEEAFWIASRVGGALYVLKKDIFFRISVGGAADAQSKLRKSKTLAQQVLKRV